MMRDHIARFVIWTAAILVAASAHAGELRPFVLPSQNTPPPTTEQRPTGVSNSYYEKFRIEAGQMDKNKINALKAEFLKRLVDARNKQHYDEQAHYERLLGILEGK